MTDSQILQDLGWVVVGAALSLLAGRSLRIPPILAYILAGLTLGPLAGLLGPSESVALFSELGIALLLFVVGLELSLSTIREIGRTAVLGGAAQVALTFGAGWGLGLLLGFEGAAAAMVGLVAAFSSTVVVVKLLDRGGELGALHGRLAVGILLVQDVLIAVVLTVLGSLAQGGGGGSPWAGLAGALLGIGGLALFGAVAGRWLLPPFFRWMSALPEGLFVVALAWVFVFILGAEALHVSIELGAFIAGVVLAQLPAHEELQRRTHPLVDFFLAVFFVSLGAGMDPAAMAASWPAALAVAAFILLAKPLLVAVLLRLLGEPAATSWRAGVTLGQMSEFAFILAALAAGGGLVDDAFFGFVGLVGFVTIGASSLLVPRSAALARVLGGTGLLDLLPGTPAPEEVPEPPLSGHVVVVGMNTLGRLLVERLHAAGEEVLAVDTDPRKLEGLPGRTRTGDATTAAVIEAAEVPAARLVVSALQIEGANALLAYRCRTLGVPVSVHAFDVSLVEELLEIGADHLMISKLDGIRPMEGALRRLGVMG